MSATFDSLPRRPAVAARERPGPAPATAPAWSAHTGSVRFVLWVALAGLFAASLAIAGFTRHHLSFRIHDYAILHLAGQMRELAAGIATDARSMAGVDPAALTAAEAERYRQRTAARAAQFDRIVGSFERRELPPDLTGLDDEVSCSWDALSMAQLRATASRWAETRADIDRWLDAPAGTAAWQHLAGRVAERSDAMIVETRELSGAFKSMMQRKLDFVIAAQAVGAVGAGAVAVLLLLWIRRRVLLPLSGAERVADRVLDGDLSVHASSAPAGREIASVLTALDSVVDRLAVASHLSAATARELTTDEVLATLRRELESLAGVVAVATARRAVPGARAWQLERVAGRFPGAAAAGCADAPIVDADTPGLVALPLPGTDGDDEGPHLLFLRAEAGPPSRAVASLLRLAADILGTQLERAQSADSLVVAAIEGLAKLAENRDPETGDHLLRMSHYAALIAAELGRAGREAGRIDRAYVDDVRRFAPMHDIGKVGVADAILRKPGKLTDEERQEMSRHPAIGGEVLRRCEAQMLARGRSVFRIGIEIAEGHHERWDGTGYPAGLQGESIPLSARIVAVADVFDALTSRRPYKEAWPIERAIATIDADRGRHFDPEVVDALHRALPAVLAFYERHKHV